MNDQQNSSARATSTFTPGANHMTAGLGRGLYVIHFAADRAGIIGEAEVSIDGAPGERRSVTSDAEIEVTARSFVHVAMALPADAGAVEVTVTHVSRVSRTDGGECTCK